MNIKYLLIGLLLPGLNAKCDPNYEKKILDLIMYSRQLFAQKIDSSIYYADLALELSRKNGFKLGEIKALDSKVSCLIIIGDLEQAIELNQLVFKKSTEINHVKGISASQYRLGTIYVMLDNLNEAKNILLEALKTTEPIKDTSNIIAIMTALSACYTETNSDLSLMYLFKAYSLAIARNDSISISAINFSIGVTYTNMKNFDLAYSYLVKSINQFKKQSNYFDLSTSYNIMGEMFKSKGVKDSAIYYGRLSFILSDSIHFYYSVLNSSKLLASIYNSINKDSTNKYLIKQIESNDSLRGALKQQEISRALISKSLNQMELYSILKAEEDNKYFVIKLLTLLVLILFIFFIFLTIRRNKYLSKELIANFGLLNLLLFFEFLSMVVHIIFDKFTNHNPFILLLSLVLIAFFLIPIHHKVEMYLTKNIKRKKFFRLRKQPPTLPMS